MSSVPSYVERRSASLVYSLSIKSVESFVTPRTHFGAQYTTSIPHHLTTMALVNIQQDEDESLRNFMERFSSISF